METEGEKGLQDRTETGKLLPIVEVFFVRSGIPPVSLSSTKLTGVGLP